MKPPRRTPDDKESKDCMSTVASELDDELQPISLQKSLSEASKPTDVETTGSSRLIVANEAHVKLLNKLMPIICGYEDFLATNKHVDEAGLREVRVFTRHLVNFIVHNQEVFTNIPRESLAYSTILLSAEVIKLNKNELIAFVNNTFDTSRFSRVSQIRKSRGYLLLSNLVKSKSSSPVL